MPIKKRFDKSYSIFIVLFLISSIMLLSNESFKATKEGALSFFTILQRGVDLTIEFTSNTINSVSELKNLKKRYDLVSKELEDYRSLDREFLEVKRENSEFKKLLNFKDSLNHDSIQCEIIGKDPSNLSSAIVINKGSKHGIKNNQPVVAEQDGLIGVVGKVINTGAYSSIVLPLLDQRSYIASRLSESRYEGLVKGFDSLDGYLQLDYVKKIALNEISIGSLVETSGMNSLYPKGYFIGRIIQIDRVDYETSLKILIEPIIDFSRLEFVSVLVPTGVFNE
ncbi:MAG: rod shape-determining protein MreC [Spirochaetales bacterium]|nr:rod shape-determining protein MreC [Spirochaetales bacterium]